MSDTDNGEKTFIRPAQRSMSTFEMFRQYWVLGRSIEEIGETTGTKPNPNERGIPVRHQSDAKKLNRGSVTLSELQREYLDEFQFELAAELAALEFKDRQRELDECDEEMKL